MSKYFLLTVVLVLVCVTQVFSAPVSWDGNNHYYDLVLKTGNWTTALDEAAASEYLGIPGHLATITSAGENAFILDAFYHDTEFLVFVGGRDLGGLSPSPTPEDVGKWVWYDGPEEGMPFYQESGSSVTPPFHFANWEDGQPSRPDIHYLAMSLNSGKWYDTNNGGYTGAPGRVAGYIVEYSTPVPVPGSLALLSLGLLAGAAVMAISKKEE